MHIRKLPAPILFRICVFGLVISLMSAGLFRFFDFFSFQIKDFEVLLIFITKTFQYLSFILDLVEIKAVVHRY